jgi:outer membrane protein OmpA-like peptidoglycan-associated protein
MKHRNRLLSLFFCLSLLSVKAQTSRLVLNYPINASDVSPHTQRLDSLLQATKQQVIQLEIIGSADFLANVDYNQKLSELRAYKVRDYLLSRTGPPQVTVVKCIGRGAALSKDNGNREGDATQRVVEISVTVKTPPKRVPDTRPIKLPDPPVAKQDTAVSLQQLSQAAKGSTIRLKGLSFIPGSHRLLPESKPVLMELLKTMKENPELKIEIQGHICCVADAEDGFDYDAGDRRLSVNRAKAIYLFLIEQGIDKSRLSYSGFGHAQPLVYPERSSEEEQLNRRVEILVQ